jgi:hypothetical protein
MADLHKGFDGVEQRKRKHRARMAVDINQIEGLRARFLRTTLFRP